MPIEMIGYIVFQLMLAFLTATATGFGYAVGAIIPGLIAYRLLFGKP